MITVDTSVPLCASAALQSTVRERERSFLAAFVMALVVVIPAQFFYVNEAFFVVEYDHERCVAQVLVVVDTLSNFIL